MMNNAYIHMKNPHLLELYLILSSEKNSASMKGLNF